MSKPKENKNQTTNGDGKRVSQPKRERLPKDFEPDESEAAQAFMKAVRIMRKRIESSKGTTKSV